jgi:hypothetical protein
MNIIILNDIIWYLNQTYDVDPSTIAPPFVNQVLHGILAAEADREKVVTFDGQRGMLYFWRVSYQQALIDFSAQHRQGSS